MKNIILLSLSLFLFSSCGENSPFAKEETLYLDEENLKWVFQDEVNSTFLMRDSNDITYSYTKSRHSHEFSDSWSSILGFTTDITHTESYVLEYNNNALFDLNLTLLLTAGFPPFGDYYSINIGSVNLHYDFKYNEVYYFYSDFGSKSYNLTDAGYEHTTSIYSEVNFLTELKIRETVYTNVMHVEFLDFKEKYPDNAVTDIYLAADIGLIKLILKDGNYLERLY